MFSSAMALTSPTKVFMDTTLVRTSWMDSCSTSFLVALQHSQPRYHVVAGRKPPRTLLQPLAQTLELHQCPALLFSSWVTSPPPFLGKSTFAKNSEDTSILGIGTLRETLRADSSCRSPWVSVKLAIPAVGRQCAIFLALSDHNETLPSLADTISSIGPLSSSASDFVWPVRRMMGDIRRGCLPSSPGPPRKDHSLSPSRRRP